MKSCSFSSSIILIATSAALFLISFFILPSAAIHAQTFPPKDYWTVPDDIPLPTIVRYPITDTTTATLADGYLFLSPHERRVNRTPFSPYELIVDNDGELVYHRKIDDLADHTRFDDFKVLPDGTLVSWFGGLRKHQLRDTSYGVIGTVGGGADLHDIHLLPNGNYMLLYYSPQKVDVSEIVEGGSTEMTYVQCHVKEVDSAGNILFDWRSGDHYALDDTYNSLEGGYVDGVQCNSVEVDTDGNFLRSSRDLYEITKINKETGDIIWRLGG